MRICVFGPGAIGGYITARLANAGFAVACIARGEHLAAIRAHGLTLESGGRTDIARPLATDDPAELGPQDFVILTLKAHQLPAAADSIAKLVGPETTLVTCMNGMPWWYFHGLDGPLASTRLSSVDPDGTLYEKLPPAQTLGAVVYISGEVRGPGVVRHTYSNRLLVGEPNGTTSARVTAFAQAMEKAGLVCPVRPNIRNEIWLKLWGNLSFNPISALTGATLVAMATDPGVSAVARAMMIEAEQVASRLGVIFPIDVDRRIAIAAEVGAHKTSMLQDLERGRTIELDALLGAIVELGGLLGVATPMCGSILALARQRAQLAGCYAG